MHTERMRSRVLPVVVWIGLAASATGVGLATVSAVRGVVADEPVRVLSAADVAALLHEPGVNLDPIATLAASDSLPRGASTALEGRQVASREAATHDDTDRSQVPTNADDRPSRLGTDPGTLGGSGGGPAGTADRTNVRTDQLGPPGSNPRTPPTPSPTATPSSAPSTPSATPSTSASAAGTPSPSMSPTGSATGSATPTPSATTSPSSSPAGTPTPSGQPSPTPSATTPAATPSVTLVPSASPSASGPSVKVRVAATTGWGLLLGGF